MEDNQSIPVNHLFFSEKTLLKQRFPHGLTKNLQILLKLQFTNSNIGSHIVQFWNYNFGLYKPNVFLAINFKSDYQIFTFP